ncbi:MAG TPA: alpha/beta hydrolase [Candidatus Baltobacteraceae bacterium]|nr:alpha/beta hydrolase [Candidatus Baltobacteraceae bacterium]
MIVATAMAFMLAAASPAAQFQYFTSNDRHRIAYTVQGAGDPMLVIPGGPGIDGAYLRRAVGGLRARSYVIDIRGTGASHVAPTQQNITVDKILGDFESMRKTLHLRSWIVMGHSFGGYLAQAYAARYPGAVRALVLVSSTAPDLRLEGSVQQSVSAMLTQGDRDKLGRAAGMMRFNPDAAAREQTDTVLPYFFADRSKWPQVRPLVDPPHNSYAMARALYPDLSVHSFAGSLRAFTAPVLMLYGEKDGGVDVFSKSIFANTPTAKLGVVKNAGHFIWVEQPRVFDGTVNTFLASLNLRIVR